MGGEGREGDERKEERCESRSHDVRRKEGRREEIRVQKEGRRRKERKEREMKGGREEKKET